LLKALEASGELARRDKLGLLPLGGCDGRLDMGVAGALEIRACPEEGMWRAERKKKKVELPLGLLRRVHLRRVLFCFDALILWIG